MEFDSYTKLCSHFDGDDNATSYTDPIAGSATLTGAVLKTAEKVFGTASVYLDGDNDIVSYASSSSWNYSNVNFTIDFRVKHMITSYSNPISYYRQYVDSSNYIDISWNDLNHRLRFIVYSGGTCIASYYCAFLPAYNVWDHVEVSRNGSNILMFKNGESKSVTEVTAISTNSLPNLNAVITLGGFGDSLGTLCGYLEEFRVSNGKCRHITDFTLDTEAYPIQSGNTSLNDLVGWIDGPTQQDVFGIGVN